MLATDTPDRRSAVTSAKRVVCRRPALPGVRAPPAWPGGDFVRSKARLALLAVLSSSLAVVGIFVAAPPASAAAPPDVTPVKVAATQLGEGHAVYVRGTDGRLYWRTVEQFAAPGYSTSWRALPGGTVASGPDAVQANPDLVYLAARATNGNLLIRSQTGTTFGPWQNLGGVITTAPTMALYQSTGDLWVFARGGDGAVWFRTRSGTNVWEPWKSIGGIVTAAPDVFLWPNATTPTVYARGTDGTLYVGIGDNAARPGWYWERIGVALNSATSTVWTEETALTQFYRGANRHVYRLDGPPGVDLGGIATSAPDASEAGEVIVVAGTDRALYARVNGQPWVRLGGITA
jgi:hypothetical protein